MRRQRIIKDDLAVSHDVQTGAVAHEDRVRTRGVRIPAEHDLLTSAGIEGDGTGVVDGPAKPAGRIAGKARSAVECEGTITHDVAVLIRGEIVINGAAIGCRIPGKDHVAGSGQLAVIEYGAAIAGIVALEGAVRNGETRTTADRRVDGPAVAGIGLIFLEYGIRKRDIRGAAAAQIDGTA